MKPSRVSPGWLVMLSSSVILGAVNGQVAPAPILRIETGMHVSAISKIDVDLSRQFLVSGSHDGTARVWDLNSGKLVRTLRSSYDTEAGVDVASVAISSDGKLVAVAQFNGVLVYDRASGALVHALYSDFADIHVSDVVFSHDGRFLAIASYGGAGVTVFRTSDFRQVFRDSSTPCTRLAVDFDKNGRLVTYCDTTLRLYDSEFKVIATRSILSEGVPFSVRFSPDGTKIAMGRIRAKDVDVVSGKDLQPIVSLPAEPVDGVLSRGYLEPTLGLQPPGQRIGASVCWSQDGTKLYAGFGNKVRSWLNADRTTAHDITATGLVTSLQSVPGGVVYSATVLHTVPKGVISPPTTAPGWGILTDSGEAKLSVGTKTVNFWKNPIELSKHGEIIQFRFSSIPSDPPAIFDIKKRLLTDATDLPGLALSPPITKANGLTVSDYDNGASAAKLNGVILLRSGPTRCLAIAPDGQSFLIGAEIESKLYTRDGRVKQTIKAPTGAEVSSVNITGDGDACVIAYSDGTIRWYDSSTGKELLALFIDTERARWVLFTPTGHYDCSPDGEELIGWQVSTGPGQAPDFFPASHFRDTFYRPDLISTALRNPWTSSLVTNPAIVGTTSPPYFQYSYHSLIATGIAHPLATTRLSDGSGEQSVQMSASPPPFEQNPLTHLPPVIRIVSPSDNAGFASNGVTVQYGVRTPSGDPVQRIRARVDGRPAEIANDLRVTATQEQAGNILVTVPSRDCKVSLIAETDYQPSDPSTITLHWTGKSSVDPMPNLYVLAVGVSNYTNYKDEKDFQLDCATKDAADFIAIMQQQRGLCYQQVEEKTLIDPTTDDILRGFQWLDQKTKSNDIAMVFMSGHGTNDKHGTWYFLPSNYSKDDLMGTGVMAATLSKIIRDTSGRAFIVFLDSCFSGNAMVSGPAEFFNVDEAIMELADPTKSGAIVFSASAGAQESQEDPEAKNGVFTRAVVEALNGQADFRHKGFITTNALDYYVSERVKELTHDEQTPFTSKRTVDVKIACHPPAP